MRPKGSSGQARAIWAAQFGGVGPFTSHGLRADVVRLLLQLQELEEMVGKAGLSSMRS